jgi:hypothetical protein
MTHRILVCILLLILATWALSHFVLIEANSLNFGFNLSQGTLEFDFGWRPSAEFYWEFHPTRAGSLSWLRWPFVGRIFISGRIGGNFPLWFIALVPAVPLAYRWAFRRRHMPAFEVRPAVK